MNYDFNTIGAIIGLVVAIVLIIKKVQPAYSLIFGALIGGIIGSGGLVTTVNTMVSGAQSMMSSVLRIMTSGILAISIATMIICAVGVFVDISVITVAPIAIAIGQKAGLTKSSILLAMIGGGKAGNIVSPNPNTIAASEAFSVDLTALMMENIIPAVFALVVTVVLA